jgi:hypothetical protein
VSSKDVRVVGPRAWVELPHDTRDTVLARLADVLATGLMVIDVELPGAQGEGLQASRATYRGVEEDVTEEAKQLFTERLAGARDGVKASELAWALIGDSDGAPSPAESNVEEEWAQALVDKLVADGLIELRERHTPVSRVAHLLQTPGRDLGDRLLAELIDSTAIDEVFADADQLAAAARVTRPKR